MSRASQYLVPWPVAVNALIAAIVTNLGMVLAITLRQPVFWLLVPVGVLLGLRRPIVAWIIAAKEKQT